MTRLSLLFLTAQETPAPEDVKAGWVAFAVFLLMGAAVVLLGFSLSKHLKRARHNLGEPDPAEKPADEG